MLGVLNVAGLTAVLDLRQGEAGIEAALEGVRRKLRGGGRTREDR